MTRHLLLNSDDAYALAIWIYVVLGIRCKVRIHTNQTWTVSHY